MRELDVVGVRMEMPSNVPMVLLREVVGHRYLPIWIGAHEASAIANAQEGVLPQRPLTHDLLAEVITGMGHRLTEVHITELTDNTFHAALLIDGVQISARPSDAIALALRTGSDIYCSEEVLDEAGIEVPEDEDDDQVEKFREFLDHVSADDFGSEGIEGPEEIAPDENGPRGSSRDQRDSDEDGPGEGWPNDDSDDESDESGDGPARGPHA